MQSLRKKLNNKTLAVVVTNIFNSPSLLLKIKKICSEKKVFLIEDNAIYFDNFFYKEKNIIAEVSETFHFIVLI